MKSGARCIGLLLLWVLLVHPLTHLLDPSEIHTGHVIAECPACAPATLVALAPPLPPLSWETLCFGTWQPVEDLSAARPVPRGRAPPTSA